VLTWESLEYPDEMYEFYVSHGLHNVGFNVEEQEGEHANSSLAREGIVERYRAFLERFLERVAAEPGRLSVRELDGARSALLGAPPSGGGPLSDQAEPFAIVSVAADGSFTTWSPELLGLSGEPYGSFTLGNVLRDGFLEVRETDHFRRLNDDIQAGVEACRETCGYFAWCGGGAPANKHAETGTMRSTETLFCRLTRKVVLDVVLEHLEQVAVRR
jgi:uncharacterized protein